MKQRVFFANLNERPPLVSSDVVLGFGHCSYTKTNEMRWNGEKGDMDSAVKTEDDLCTLR